MTSKASGSGTFTRLSRIGLSLGLKPSFTNLRENKKQQREDEDWYIPYNGPYEPPPGQRGRGERNSLDGEDEETALASRELHKTFSIGHGSYTSDSANVVDQKLRGRTQSFVSGRTISSGAIDPSRPGTVTQRRSTVSTPQRPPAPSYINLDSSGGVGESPMPPIRRLPKDQNSPSRASIISLFSFGSSSRKALHSPKTAPAKISRNSKKSERPASSLTAGTFGPRPRCSSESHEHRQSKLRTSVFPPNAVDSVTTDEDYYNSYYSTLIPSPGQPNPSSPVGDPLRPPESENGSPSPVTPSSASQHPYAYVYLSEHAADEPQTAPAWSNSQTPDATRNIPRLTFSAPKNAASAGGSTSFNISRSFAGGMKKLRSSISTPNLQAANEPTSHLRNPHATKPAPKIKDRWLSAETWCDALLFPRPRLKVRQQGDGAQLTSGRIVSPPGSPIGGNEKRLSEDGVQSRVLAHSRSVGELRKRTNMASSEAGPSRAPVPAVPSDTTRQRPPRPKSFAQDDLALPSPVPSLTKVLEEGKTLDRERKQWQAQATHSFQNKQTRSVSRGRSKSLTNKGKRKEDSSNLEFLAVRAYLGSQAEMPTVSTRPPQQSNSQTTSTSTGTFSRISHAYSSSLSKTLSKSSKSHSHGHSRTDSFGRTVLRKRDRSATVSGASNTEHVLDARGVKLETVLKGDETTFIRLADPAQIQVESGPSVSSTSPAPSGGSADVRMGIAISTPPLDGDARDALKMPSHPYAQGGLSYRTDARLVRESPTDTGLEHSSSESSQAAKAPQQQQDEGPRRQRPPPHLHPYAQASRDSFYEGAGLKPQLRPDSDVPPPAKMWAAWSPGVVREILPHEIQYSPFISESGHESLRTSTMILDTVGVGEALANAVRLPEIPRKAPSSVPASPQPKRAYRQPVQYDASRPPYVTQLQNTSDPSPKHTFASSSMLPREVSEATSTMRRSSSVDDLRRLSLSPGVASDNSSPQPSPRFFDNPDDIQHFHDLFYRPRALRDNDTTAATAMAVSLGATTPTSSLRSRLVRTGSGLTSLARQLSEEYEQLAAERESSQYSRSSIAVPNTADLNGGGRQGESSLEFVFEEGPPREARAPVQAVLMDPIQAFKPSGTLPVDVEAEVEAVSLGSSSPTDSDHGGTELFRVGVIESVTTPPAVQTDHRSSMAGQMSEGRHSRSEGHASAHEPENEPTITQPRVASSSLPLPSADPTRSSYMTTSTASRMSNLSDFPAPPRHAGHMSLLSSYFEEAMSQRDSRASTMATPPPPLPELPLDDRSADRDREHRFTFGGVDEEIDEMIAAFSSTSHVPHTLRS